MVPLTLHTAPLLKSVRPVQKPMEAGLNPGAIYISACEAGSMPTGSWLDGLCMTLPGRFNDVTG